MNLVYLSWGRVVVLSVSDVVAGFTFFAFLFALASLWLCILFTIPTLCRSTAIQGLIASVHLSLDTGHKIARDNEGENAETRRRERLA